MYPYPRSPFSKNGKDFDVISKIKVNDFLLFSIFIRMDLFESQCVGFSMAEWLLL